MICPNCNSKVPAGMKFCTVCGTNISSPDAGNAQRYCVRCGQPCEEGRNLCRECRAKKAAAKAAAAGDAAPVRKKKKKSSPLVPVLIALIVIFVLLCAFGVWLLFGHSVTESGESTEVVSATAGEETDSSGYSRIKEDTSAKDETAAEAETASEEESEPEEVTYVPTYQVIAGDVSWKEANTACEEMGGHLATITSEEEYETICALADESGLTYLWLGAHITDASQDYAWDDGEEWTFDKWYPDEPSKADLDGTQEYYLCLWNAKYDGEEIGWTFNDQRGDIAGDFASVSGLVGYICEIEVPEN